MFFNLNVLVSGMKGKKSDTEDNKSDSDIDEQMPESDVEMESNDDESYDKNSNDSDLTGPKSMENPAWADAMSKILKTNKPKRRKTIVLSRAKRANEVKPEIKKETLDFEIDGENELTTETVKHENPDDELPVKRLKVSFDNPNTYIYKVSFKCRPAP